MSNLQLVKVTALEAEFDPEPIYSALNLSNVYHDQL
jgi:hypothetical protein